MTDTMHLSFREEMTATFKDGPEYAQLLEEGVTAAMRAHEAAGGDPNEPGLREGFLALGEAVVPLILNARVSGFEDGCESAAQLIDSQIASTEREYTRRVLQALAWGVRGMAFGDKREKAE